MPNYLIHYGILGQKWGRRNGPPYPLTESKMSKSEKKAGAKPVKEAKEKPNSKWFEPTIKGGKDKPNISPAEKTLLETKKVTENASSISRSIGDMRRASRRHEDLSGMSDADLRNAVNRLNLERQYYGLTEPETTRGEIYARDILDIAGDLVAIGVSAATLITLVKSMK